jgi:uncharacterized membrane protein
MSWIFSYRCRSFLRSSLWLAPVASMLAACLLAPLIRAIDDRTQWTLLGFGFAGSRAVIGALSASLLSFIVFAVSMILVAVQVASGQLSPRIIPRIFESHLIKVVLSAFVFAYAYSLTALGRIENRVPQLPILTAILSSLVSIVLFLYLIQKASHSLRPVIVLGQVAGETRRVIQATYPNAFSPHNGEHPDLDSPPAKTAIIHSGRSGVILAIDTVGLVEMATRADCIIELVPRVGDFLAPGEDLFHLHGTGTDRVPVAALQRCVALGPEQSITEGPAFGIRVLVEIAIRALSPSANDPTTTVLAIDQIHLLLYLLGQRQLDTGVLRDSTGALRLVCRTPCWEDFVTMAVTDIRIDGFASPQITRRLTAMFKHLVRNLPEERSGVLFRQMALLRRTIDRGFGDPEDRILAATSDMQGFGSPQHDHAEIRT